MTADNLRIPRCEEILVDESRTPLPTSASADGAVAGRRGLPPRSLLNVGWKVRDLLHLAHFDNVAVQHGRALRPFDRFGAGLHLDHPVAAEHLLRLGERPVGHLGLVTGEAYAGARGGWLQPVEPEQDAGLGEGLVVLGHFGDKLGRGRAVRPRLLVPLRDHQHHESHRAQFLLVWVRRAHPGFIEASNEEPQNRHAGPTMRTPLGLSPGDRCFGSHAARASTTAPIVITAAPIARARRSGRGPSRSAAMATATAATTALFIIPPASRTAIRPTQHRLQFTP